MERNFKHLVLCSQQPFIAMGLAEALRERPELELITCDTLPRTLACLRAVQPAAIVVHTDFGITRSELHELFAVTRAPVVLWGDSFGYEFSYQAFQCGLRGILSARMPVDALLAALEDIMSGGLCFAKEVMENLLCHEPSLLTRRERQVTSLVAQGLKNKEIAVSLGLSEGTVKVYVSKIFQKLGMNGRVDLALYGLRTMFSDCTGLDSRRDRAPECPPERDFLPHSFLLPSRAQPQGDREDRTHARGQVH
jgi:DNA-binding NarL/FixJ family response regulator